MPLQVPKDKQEIIYKSQESNSDGTRDYLDGYILHYLERCALVVDLETGWLKEIPYENISFLK